MTIEELNKYADEIAAPHIEEINEELQVLTKEGFVPQHLVSPSGSDFDNRIEYKGYWIFAEYPNGGMAMISIMHIWLKVMFSYPCGVKGIEPFFGYDESEKAIGWAKSVIDKACPFYPE